MAEQRGVVRSGIGSISGRVLTGIGGDASSREGNRLATFGIECIKNFANARANGVSTAGDFTYAFNISNGLDDKLRSRGHVRTFYWSNQDCFENDIRDDNQGGDDKNWADKVDLFFIMTHGNHTAAGAAQLLYDVPNGQWRTFSNTWSLGENFNAEWILCYSCKTVDLNKLGGLWNMFNGLHMFCGAYDNMWDGWTTEECGRDVGQNLIDGHTVSHSWIEGVSDWSVDNHPAVVCVGTSATWNNGNIRWDTSYMNRDHLSGHGEVMPDLPPSQQGCILVRWAEG
ncbi:MAG TPA: DUF6345 domain-containing protein [Acidimicrobiales bacterium]|nr:DUF6345 domain-containing protein [Acidimicrobiales bacterium]